MIINICESEFHVLSNFSSHQVEIDGVLYPTCEHAYHALRYNDIEIQKEIIQAKSARKAWEISQWYKDKQLEDFDKVVIMKSILIEKLNQHEDVREALFNSQDSILEKQIEVDLFWGISSNNQWKNMLWNLWMEIRNKLAKNHSHV